MVSETGERLQQVLARIDQLNAQDPTQELLEGTPQPRELVYARRLTRWALRLAPDASEALRIAARGQHVQRWTIPRSRYEMNRRGYLRWRETLKTFHADTVAGLMREAGYPGETIERVRRLMTKKELGRDPETQSLEDALCLLFLETQFADLRRKTAPEKMRAVVQKTWKKMSEPARALALTVPLAEDDRQFLLGSVGEHREKPFHKPGGRVLGY